jgi:hypothetical protein
MLYTTLRLNVPVLRFRLLNVLHVGNRALPSTNFIRSILFDIIIKLAINPKELVGKMMHDMPCFRIVDEVFALYRRRALAYCWPNLSVHRRTIS